MNAVKRVEGYCCKVTENQWEQLVEVADKIGISVDGNSRKNGTENEYFPYAYVIEKSKELFTYDSIVGKLIPFHDFLSKLRGGAETWTPKAGDMVEVSDDGVMWLHKPQPYITLHQNFHIVQSRKPRGGWEPLAFGYVRPARPRMTKAEAEKLLNCIITDT